MPGGVRAEAIRGLEGDKEGPSLLLLLADPDPFLRHAAVRQAARTPAALEQIAISSVAEAKQRAGLLLAYRTAGENLATGLIHFLKDPDPNVRLLAAKWVSDEKLGAFRPQIAGMMKQPNLDPRSYVALATTLARLDGKPVNEDGLATYFLERLHDKDATPVARLMALRAIPANHNRLKLDHLTELLKQNDPTLRVEALRALKDRGDAKAAPAVLALVKDAKQPTAVRAQALVTLSAMNANTVFLIGLVGDTDPAIRQEALRALVGVKFTADEEIALRTIAAGKEDTAVPLARVRGKAMNANRPAMPDTAAWLARLEGPADVDAGRRVFEHPKLAACFKCHQVDGRGANVGPDLSLIGRTDRKWIVESILQPTAVVAPHYQAWTIRTTDERTRTGLLTRTYLDESEYIDEQGNRFKVLANEVLDVKAARVSVMPDKLLDGLTDQEVRDLVAYLASRK